MANEMGKAENYNYSTSGDPQIGVINFKVFSENNKEQLQPV